MEVSLLEADGIPEGCLISVRAGSTRRQAPAEAGKPCKLWFPRGIQNANPFKVDLLAPLGSTVLEVGPSADSYPIEVKQRYGGSPMKVTLRVREEANENAVAPEIAFNSASKEAGNFAGIDSAAIGGSGSNNESPARRHQMALEARSYLDQHSLLQFIQGLLQELIKERPGDPWTYIDGRTAKMREKLGPKSEAPADAGPPMTEIPKQPMPEPSKEEIPKQPVLEPSKDVPTIEELRLRAREALEGEVFRQKSEAEKQRREAEPVETLRDKVCQTFSKASADGRLDAAFSQMREEREKVKEPPSASTATAWMPHPLTFSGPMGMPGTMMGAQVFMCSAMSHSQMQPGTAKEPTAELTEPVSADATVLPTALEQLDRVQSPEKYTKERVTPGQSLHSMAPQDWSKVSSVIETMPPAPIQEPAAKGKVEEEALCTKGPEPAAPVEASSSPLQVPSSEDLRERAKSALIQANRDGNLLQILEEKGLTKLAEKATEAAPVPFTALPSVCTWIGHHPRRQRQPVSQSADASQASGETRIPSSELRDQVKTALVTACMDGRLAAALRQEPAEVGRDDLCSQAREAIMSACADGRLADALKRVVAPEAEVKHDSPVRQEVSEPAVSAKAASACSVDTETAVSGPPPPKEPRCAQAAPPPSEAAAPPRHNPPMSSRSVSATPRPNERLTPLFPAPIVGAAPGIDAADAELKLRQRTERFKQENDALRKENARLKKLREAGDAAGMLCSENDRLRAELGKLLTMNKKEHPLRSKGAGSASCPKF